MPGIIYRYFSYTNEIVFNELLWCLGGFLVILIASFYVSFLKKDFHVRMVANLRGALLMTALVYFLASVLPARIPGLVREEVVQGLSLTQRLMPNVNSIIAAIVAFYAWFSVIFHKKTFKGVELFSEFSETYRGEMLHRQMREFAPEMGDAHDELKSITRGYGMTFIPACLILNLSGYAGTSLFLTILIFMIFIGGILILGFFGLQRRELAYATEGISLTMRDKALPVPIMVIGIAIAAILAIVGSSDNSLLSPHLAYAALLGFISFITSFLGPMDPSEIRFQDIMSSWMPGADDTIGEGTEPVDLTPWEGWIYVRFIIIGLIIFLFLLFMVYPILKKSKLSLKGINIFKMFAAWISNLKNDILAFFSAFGEKDTSVRIEDKEKIEKIASGILSKKPRSKSLVRSVNLFARLILWGIETLSIQWKPSFAPGEYSLLLAAATGNPDTGNEILRSAELFEKSLYSYQDLSSEEEDEYRSLVEGIIGVKA